MISPGQKFRSASFNQDEQRLCPHGWVRYRHADRGGLRKNCFQRWKLTLRLKSMSLYKGTFVFFELTQKSGRKTFQSDSVKTLDASRGSSGEDSIDGSKSATAFSLPWL